MYYIYITKEKGSQYKTADSHQFFTNYYEEKMCSDLESQNGLCWKRPLKII